MKFLIFVLCFFGLIGAQAQNFKTKYNKLPSPNTQFTKEVEALVGEQKYQAALDKVEAYLKAKKSEENDIEYARALIKKMQLQLGLHGYETAVKDLKKAQWPKDPMAQALVELYFGYSLINYYNMYSWEINQREEVVSGKEIDLKKWTKDQIDEQINKSFYTVWIQRLPLGELAISDFSEFFRVNNYPPQIRPTLRDTLTYLWIQHLANSGFWSPKESNTTTFYNLEKLLNGEIKGPRVHLPTPKLHPVEKISFLTKDLQNWHDGKKESEAALEIQLEQARLLRTHFATDKHKNIFTSYYDKLINRAPDKDWKAKAYADYAEALMALPDTDALIRARKIALLGIKKFPGTIGASFCKSLVDRVESPSINIASMFIDGQNKPSIQLTYKNLEKVYFKAYKMDLKKLISGVKDYNLFPSYQELEKLLSDKTPDVSWEAPLRKTEDFKEHKKYIVPQLKDKGYYIVLASVKPNILDKQANEVRAVNFIYSDLVLKKQKLPSGEWRVTTIDGKSGNPLSEVPVELYRYDYQKGHQQIGTFLTDSSGEVLLKDLSNRYNYFLFAKKGEDISIDHNSINFYSEGQVGHQNMTLIYTDRSVYRPGQKIYFKILSFGGDMDKGDLSVQNNHHKPVNIQLRDANYKNVAELTLTTNLYGTASGEFSIPTGRALGQWQIQAQAMGVYGNSMIQVEEYKRPTFEVTMETPKSPLSLNKSAKLNGSVKYYFGLPVTEGEVKWQVHRSVYWPWWWSWYYWGSGSSYYNSQSQMVASGVSKLNSSGEFDFTFTPEADKDLETTGVNYNYQVKVDVTDIGGETRSAERGFRIGFVDIQAILSQEQNYISSEQDPQFKVFRSSLNGLPLAGEGTWKLYKVQQPEKTRTLSEEILPLPPIKMGVDYSHEDDRKNPRWNQFSDWKSTVFHWNKSGVVDSGKVVHDKEGKGQIKTKKLDTGFYRLEYATKDSAGKPFNTRHDFYVVNKNNRLNIPLIVAAEKYNYQPGEKFRLFVHSGFKNQKIQYDFKRNNKIFKRGVLEVEKNGSFIEFDITEDLRGGFAYFVSTIHDHQWNSLSGSVSVPWSNKMFNVEYETFRDKLRPGSKEKFTLKLFKKDKNNKNIPLTETAEVLTYMYDRSLDAFRYHTSPSPISSYPSFTYFGSVAQTNLGMAPISYMYGYNLYSLHSPPYLQPDDFIFYSNYGIGGLGTRERRFGAKGQLYESDGMAMSDMAMPAAAPMEESITGGAPAKLKKAMVGKNEAESKEVKQDSAKDKSVADKDSSGDSSSDELRTNFSETAFWKPHLISDKEGKVSFEFEVPDSVTSWNLWTQAVTKNILSGSLLETTQTVKELMIRPYLPRFLREADKGDLRIVATNASDKEMDVQLTLEIFDPQTQANLLKDFGLEGKLWTGRVKVPAKGSQSISVPLKAPSKISVVGVRVKGKSGAWSDGEQKNLPILPSRMHLLQSRFAALKNNKTRILEFPDMAKGDDPSLINKSLIVTMDAQLLYSVLSAVPYLVDYPYECTEQTLNRFITTGILNEVFKDHPAIAKMGRNFANSRDSQFEKWNKEDPNRLILLEETPWLNVAEGGSRNKDQLIKVLDPKVALKVKESAIRRLEKSQTAVGGFPWFPGGAPSPYITLLVVDGFSKALEFGVKDISKPMVVQSWNYLFKHYKEYEHRKHSLDFLVYINYVASNFPDETWLGKMFTEGERKSILEYTLQDWKKLSPRLKAYLSLTAHRMQRPKEAELIFASIMDSAKNEEDQGTFWAAEDRSWLWYNDTIESHAYVLRAMTELQPKDPRRDGLVQWLFLNKKLNHWKSTRATAEVLYSLIHYLKAENQLGIKEQINIKIGDQKKEFKFQPDKYEGKSRQWVVKADQLDPKTMSKIEATKTDPALGFVSATWHFSTEKLPEKGDGDFLNVERQFFLREVQGDKIVLKPLAEGAEIKVGDEVEIQLSIRAKHSFEYVHLRDPRAAGLEPGIATSGWEWDLGIPRYREIRDSATNFFLEYLPVGEYTLKYRVKANMSGQFRVGPARLQAMYAPEFGAYSSGKIINIK